MSENYGNGPAAPAFAQPRREYFTKRQTLLVAASTVVAAALGVGCVFAAQDAFSVARGVASAVVSGSGTSAAQTGAAVGGQGGYAFGDGSGGYGAGGFGGFGGSRTFGGDSGYGASGGDGSFGGYSGGQSQAGGSGGGSSDPFGGSQYGSQSGSGSATGAADQAPATSAESKGIVLINTQLSYEGEAAAGTGMILTKNGEVLTNNHVIEGATSISVEVVSTGKTYTAKVVGDDPSDDVAVLQLQNASGLATAKTDASAKVKTSDEVIGVGNAEGGEKLLAAPGTVTALNQSITTEAEDTVASESLHGLIETDAGIEPGDSGGPLYNASGKIIGMDTAASSGGPADGYAIPISSALSIAKQIESGKASGGIEIGYPAFLGVELSTDASGSGSGIGTSTGSGAQISGVTDGGPAEAAGIAAGDTITAIGGTRTPSTSALQTAIKGYQPGDKVAVTWTDGSGQSHTATGTLTTGPAA